MAETHLDDHNAEVHHEDSDVNVRAILLFTVIFILGNAVIFFVIWFLYRGLAVLEKDSGSVPVSLVATEGRQLPPEPRLQPFPRGEQEQPGILPGQRPIPELPGHDESQKLEEAMFTTPVYDMDVMLAEEKRLLTTYGWVDRPSGKIRIPIEDAIRITAARGLPVRTMTLTQPLEVVPPVTPVATSTPAATSTAPAPPATAAPHTATTGAPH